MKEIPLNKNKVALVDDWNYDRVMLHNWYSLYGGNGNWYAVTSIKINGVWKTISMHRFILNASRSVVVDHIDFNGLNNQELNIRTCTISQNTIRNSIIHKRKSLYRGVTFTRWNKPIARITVNSKKINLGTFINEETAAKAYDIAAKKYHGEFAMLNFN